MNKDKLKEAMEERENESPIFRSLGKVDLENEHDKQVARDEQKKRVEDSMKRRKLMEQPTTEIGYINVSINNLESRGRFYPKDIFIQIRSANVKEIEHYSIMNDQDPTDVDYHLNDIIRACCRVVSVSNPEFTSMDIVEGDRIYLILAIKDLTFPDSENKLTYELQCPHCGHENTRELKSNILESIVMENSKIEKYYNEDDRCYNVETKNYGIIKMIPPKLGLIEYIYKRGMDLVRNKKYWDKSYYTILPYIYTGQCDKIDDKDIDKLYTSYLAWDKTKYSVVYRLAEQIRIGVSPNLNIVCDEVTCQKEFITPFRIPGGPKALFIIQDIDNELV